MMNKKFVIVTPSYNNSRWVQRNIESILSQEYDAYRLVYVDDCSTDGTADLAARYMSQYQQKNSNLIRNSERRGAFENLYMMIHSCDDDEIIVTVDGDDWFPHTQVLARLNQVYSDPNIWMTYGQYKQHPTGNMGGAQQIPQHIINRVKFREYDWCATHLRTFYAHLFKKIKKDDLMHDGKFYPMAWDLAMMFPMLEMSGSRSKFLNEILYVYNIENPLNDNKVNVQLQQTLESIIRRKPTYPLL